MHLAFHTKTLRELCESEHIAEKELGVKISTQLKNRISDLQASENVQQFKNLFLSKVTEIKIEDELYLIVDLTDDFILSFCANHINNPILDDQLFWEKIQRIKIMRIGENNYE